MKKSILTAVAMSTMLFGLQAQTEIKTYDACDANLTGEVNVGDAEYVANHVLTQTAGQNVVTAEQLNDVLKDIYQLLGKLNTFESKLADIESHLEYIMSDIPDEHGVHSNGHQYVDLGVVVGGKTVYWATTNIGAESPADYGLYFAWGETVGYKNDKDGRTFDYANYNSDLCGGSSTKMKKYCTKTNYGTVDNKTVLEPEDDAAHVNWHGDWRMPTSEELGLLKTQCTWTWTTMTNSAGKSINGYKVSNKTDSSKYIFLPAAGYCYAGGLGKENSDGDYWSSSLYTTDNSDAYSLDFHSGYIGVPNLARCYGFTVRPVCQ